MSDTRESPAIQLINLLEKKKYKVDYYDPYVKKLNNVRSLKATKYSKNLNTNLNKYSCILLVTDHDCINYDKLLNKSTIIFDCRGRYRKLNEKKVINV